MSRIVTLYSAERRAARPVEMAFIRWYRISAALARLGHIVDIASDELRWWLRSPPPRQDNLRVVPLRKVRWHEYDVVKTLFHSGFEYLERHGGHEHPFIIAKLGSVVGNSDMEGIYFYGRARERMFQIQERINRASRYVTLLSEPAAQLWRSSFVGGAEPLIIPGAAESEIPPPGRDPYPAGRMACVFAGNFYTRKESSQPGAHTALVHKLNRLGALLHRRGVQLYVIGPGNHRSLDRRFVDYRGAVPYHDSWDYIRYAAVGIVVSAGEFMHNNESTKIYYYLRAGTPVVSEAGFPNDHVVRDAGLGFVVENGNLECMADRIVEAATIGWDRDSAVRYVLEHHTWDKRAEVYDRLLRDTTSAAVAL
jgi:hypothetical protein